MISMSNLLLKQMYVRKILTKFPSIFLNHYIIKVRIQPVLFLYVMNFTSSVNEDQLMWDVYRDFVKILFNFIK